MTQPKISIIVPVYNTEKYLKRCVDSMVKQTLRELEIILVDDGSKEPCALLCDELAATDPRIKVILTVLYIVCSFLCRNLFSFLLLIMSAILLILLGCSAYFSATETDCRKHRSKPRERSSITPDFLKPFF